MRELFKRENEYVQLLLRVILEANASTSFESSMRVCLKDVCEFMKWPVGHLYVISGKGRPLVPTKIWYLKDEVKFDAFVKVTEKAFFDSGDGLPGEVLLTGKMVWVPDIYLSPNFPRARLARDLNVKSGFAFPLVASTEILGIMEFFSHENSRPDAHIVKVMTNIGVQMGRIFARHQEEQKLKLLSCAVEQNQASVMITDTRGFIEYVNPSFTRYTGYTFEEAVGKKPSILKSGQQPPDFYKTLWETILSGQEWKNNVCNRKKNGDLYWEYLSISPILDEHGKISKFISFRLEDTLRKTAEDYQKTYTAKLGESLEKEKLQRQAIEIANSQLKHFSNQVQQNIVALENAYLLTLNSLSLAAEYKDNNTGQHLARISKYSEIMARAAGMDAEEVKLIKLASPMHDIGKVGIPDNIMQKKSKLTDAEFELVKKHTLIGAEILGNSDAPIIALARDVALAHHEKWNGEGYPHRLVGEDIPLSARIVSLVDCFDALTTSRHYKKAYPLEIAHNIIIGEKGKSFDPRLVEIFVDRFEEFKQLALSHMEENIEKEASFQLSERDQANQ